MNELDRILQDAEKAVLEVLATAAASGDYATIDKARQLAEQIRLLAGVREVPANRTKASRAVRKAQPTRRKRRPAKSEYPKFRIEGRSMFKTGWSKKKQAEYEQRVPIECVDEVVVALDALSTTTPGPITGEKILESSAFSSAGHLPSYQVYIVLAMLREHGVVTSVGREGYRLEAGLAARAREAVEQISADK